jgi:signal transduction histidine kinase
LFVALHEPIVDSQQPQADALFERLRVGTTHVSRDAIVAFVWQRVKRLHPLLVYRIIAFAIAVVIMASHLHAQTSLTEQGRVVLVAFAHLLLTAVFAPRLPNRLTPTTVLVATLDGLICVLLMAATFGWRGPFWLYSLSAIFWPAFVFPLVWSIVAVTAFDGFILVTNFNRIRATISDGFGGDLVARLLMVYIIAGAISLTARAMASARALATEAERNRIARDLHDGVGKTMGGISLEARSLSQWIGRDPAEARRRARYVARVSERAALEVRDVIRGLRQSEATESLFPTVRTIVDDWQQQRAETVHLRLNGPDMPVPVLIHGAVVRMLGELLANVGRHANASEVWVRMTLSSSGVTLSVRDNGIGFDFGGLDPWADEGHFGLMGTRERASMLGGRFRVASIPGSGTEVTIDIPLLPREEPTVHVLH